MVDEVQAPSTYSPAPGVGDSVECEVGKDTVAVIQLLGQVIDPLPAHALVGAVGVRNKFTVAVLLSK